ncbi:MAG: ATP phosphoribosyltransferase _ HisGs, partial [uncultured Rubrobacteraceae bacterium]
EGVAGRGAEGGDLRGRPRRPGGRRDAGGGPAGGRAEAPLQGGGGGVHSEPALGRARLCRARGGGRRDRRQGRARRAAAQRRGAQGPRDGRVPHDPRGPADKGGGGPQVHRSRRGRAGGHQVPEHRAALLRGDGAAGRDHR